MAAVNPVSLKLRALLEKLTLDLAAAERRAAEVASVLGTATGPGPDRGGVAIHHRQTWGSPGTLGWCRISVGSMSPHLHTKSEEIATFCRRNHIRKLAFFGSVLRADFRDDSDIDVLVEFEPGHVPGFAFFGMQDELGGFLGRKIDLHTPASLSDYFRDQVLREAEPAYVAA